MEQVSIYYYFHQLEWLSCATNTNILHRNSATRMRLDTFSGLWRVLAWTQVFYEYPASVFRVEERQEAPINVGKFRLHGVIFQITTFLTVITVIASKFTQFFFALYFSFTADFKTRPQRFWVLHRVKPSVRCLFGQQKVGHDFDVLSYPIWMFPSVLD